MVQASRLAKNLFEDSKIFLVIYMAGTALSFAVHLFLARALGAFSYGYFAYACSWLAVLVLGCHIGLKPTVLRFTASYQAGTEWGLLRGLLGSSSQWTMAASALILSLATLALWWLDPQPEEKRFTLWLVLSAMPLLAICEVWSFAIRGLGAVARSQLPASIVQHTGFAAGLIVLFQLIDAPTNAVSAATAYLVATFLSALVAGYLLWRTLPMHTLTHPVYRDPRIWANVAWGNFLTSVFSAARLPLVVIIAAMSVEPGHIAFFVAAERLASLASMTRLAISSSASHQIARYFSQSDFTALQQLARLSARTTLATAILVSLVIAGLGKLALGLFGAGFVNAYPSLLILLCGELLFAAVGPAGYFLNMTGWQMNATQVEAAASFLALALAITLIPVYGIKGAAIAIAASAALRSIAMFAAVWYRLHIRCTVL